MLRYYTVELYSITGGFLNTTISKTTQYASTPMDAVVKALKSCGYNVTKENVVTGKTLNDKMRAKVNLMNGKRTSVMTYAIINFT